MQRLEQQDRWDAVGRNRGDAMVLAEHWGRSVEVAVAEVAGPAGLAVVAVDHGALEVGWREVCRHRTLG